MKFGGKMKKFIDIDKLDVNEYRLVHDKLDNDFIDIYTTLVLHAEKLNDLIDNFDLLFKKLYEKIK
jgi:hypothetical protein